MVTITNVAMVALGGAIGCTLRYLVININALSAVKGLGTIIVNITGCFIIGILYSIFSRWKISDSWRLLLFIGVLGGFTTFSTFGLDIITMLKEGETMRAIGYILASNILGILATFGGAYITRLILKQIN